MKQKFTVLISVILFLLSSQFSFAQDNTSTLHNKVANSSRPYVEDKLLVIGTGAVTGVYYPAGGAICRLVNKDRAKVGLRCAVESTPGSIYNIDALKAGEVEIALVQSDWQEHAFNGTGEFAQKGRFDKMRFLFSLHNESLTLIARKHAKIDKLDDIKGKNVSFGSIGSGVRATMDDVMRAKGWTKEDFKSMADLRAADQAKAICSGNIDALVIATGHPNGLVQEITSSCETKFININDDVIQKLIEGNPEFSKAIIPGGLYAGVPDDIQTFGVKSTVITTSDTSDQVAYDVTKLVFDNISAFRALHPVFMQLNVNRMATEGRTAPYHPGALKYFEEKGLVKNDGAAIQPAAAQ